MPDAVAYFRESNESSVVICQMESERGVNNAEEIAATPGVDCLWVGHYDLSQSMGIPAQFHSDRFLDALNKVVAGARKHGKLLGIQPGNAEQADEWISMGFNVISWSADIAVYRSSLQSGVNHLRQRLAQAQIAR
jgi:2-dehydro-3-deoxyglucarate aldolase/4-hydroxy-2-oxoheptanedioate aldolase